jgi:AcrR family transcriptional regulator
LVPSLRDRILDAGVDLICTEGWRRVTMAQLAQRAGISRQMVYKEIGARDKLAKAIIARHADRFLDGVIERLRAHRGDPVAGIGAAVDYVLRAAADDPLLKGVLSAAHGGGQELLPLLTTNSEAMLQQSVQTLLTEATALYPGLPPGRLATLAEVVVRLTMSHLIRPFGPIEDGVRQVVWIVRNALSGPAPA